MKRVPSWAVPVTLGCILTASSAGAQEFDDEATATVTVASRRDSVQRDTVTRVDKGLSFWERLWQSYRSHGYGRITGDVTATSELYAQQGAAARRPGQAWRMEYNPQMNIIGSVSVSANLLLSSEGNQLRQNINQAGFNPRWSWGSASFGDFTKPYSPYTTQGLRVRGYGVDVTPGQFRFAVQSGRTQRAVSSLTTGPVFQRRMFSAKAGLGSEDGYSFDLTVLKAKDDVNSVESVLLVVDSMVLDTLVDDETAALLRPRLNTFNRPQENLVVSLAGQLPLLRRSLIVRGEVARSAVTRDLLSPRADQGGLSGLARTVSRLFMPIHLSTSDDIAYNVDVDYHGSRGSFRAGYEEVGAGYSSLGLGYLINDRRAYTMNGSINLFDQRLVVQGQYQHQNDNLLGQLESTTNRDVFGTTIAFRPTNRMTTTFTAISNAVTSHAPIDTFALDNQSITMMMTTAVAHQLFGRTTSTALSYAFQQTTDGNTVRNVPSIAVHNTSLSTQFMLSPTISVSPSLSAVVTRMSATPEVASNNQYNVLAGFRGQGKFLDGRLQASGDINHTFSNGRRVFGIRSNAGYMLPGALRLTVQSRFNNYSATPTRQAFREFFLTTGIARSF